MRHFKLLFEVKFCSDSNIIAKHYFLQSNLKSLHAHYGPVFVHCKKMLTRTCLYSSSDVLMMLSEMLPPMHCIVAIVVIRHHLKHSVQFNVCCCFLLSVTLMTMMIMMMKLSAFECVASFEYTVPFFILENASEVDGD